MKIKHLIIPGLILLISLNTVSSQSLAYARNKQEKKEQKSNVIIIPDKVKAIFEEGMKTREPRLDIPFSIIWHLYLPAQQNMHSVFFFKVKNSDLGFSPVAAAEIPGKKAEEEKEKTTPSETETPPAQLKASGHVFLQFNRLENSLPKELVKEVYIPFNFEADSQSYQPDKEELYSTAYPIPPGNYLLSMAITSLNLEKIGTQYLEFSLPDSLSFTEELGTTPIFFVKGIKRMSSPETTAEVHKDFFTYSVLQIKPHIENSFNVGENLDIFFFIFGARRDEAGKYNIDVNYTVFKGEEKVIRYATAHYNAPIVSQPLPMKKTVLIKSEKEGEKKEQRDLEPGKYKLQISIDDKLSGNSAKKSIDFNVK